MIQVLLVLSKTLLIYLMCFNNLHRLQVIGHSSGLEEDANLSFQD